MLAETKKKVMLAVSSTVISLIMVGAVFEMYKSYQYNQWKSDYQSRTDWYGGLTISSSSPVLMWEYRANGVFEDTTHDYTIRTNRYGFRDRDYESAAKSEGVVRVAFIGDSVTLGLFVSNDMIFVRRFENYINEAYNDFKVQALNFGVDGYNAVQINELLRLKVLDSEPDKVVYMMCLNDFDFEDASGEKIRYFRKPSSFLLLAIEELFERRKSTDHNYAGYYEYHFEKNKQVVFQNIVEMKNLLDYGGIDFQVVLIPVFSPSAENFGDYFLRDMHSEITQVLTANRIALVDLLYAFMEQREPPRFFSRDAWHPNEEGHNFIAEQLVEVVSLNK